MTAHNRRVLTILRHVRVEHHHCPSCKSSFAGGPLARYCSSRCRATAARQRRRRHLLRDASEGGQFIEASTTSP
jgi:predicted nucleic acid-binding Zn ribbon protein